MFKKRSIFQLKRDGNRIVNTYLSTIQIIFIYYAMMTFVAFILLGLPFFQKPGVHISIFDTLFMAISTISVTGLTTFNINEVYNDWGVVLLEILFQIGGLGIMMIATFFFIISKRKISLKTRQLIMTDMNQPRLSGSVKLIKNTVYTLLGIQLFFGFIFGIRFFLIDPHKTLKAALFEGFYQSISAVTNSGFDVTGLSATPYSTDYVFITMLIFLIMIGGIGFPVITEVKEWISYKRKQHDLPFRFSLFTKLAVTIYIILFIFGMIAIFFLERNHIFSNMSSLQKWMTSAFYSATTRNAGLQMNDIGTFQTPTLLLFSILMFIGCSPSSVGGGVRTTTIAILGLYTLAFIRGKENATIFNRRIDDDDIKKAIVVFNLSLVMCFLAIILLSVTEQFTIISIIVEVTSAFGTTGLSLGITPELTTIGKITIAFLMFVGRIGMLYTLMIFVPKERQDQGYVHASEKIIIG